jgi:hypothetical protein
MVVQEPDSKARADFPSTIRVALRVNYRSLGNTASVYGLTKIPVAIRSREA